MQTSHLAVVPLLLCALAACGSSTSTRSSPGPASGTVDGTVGGTGFTVASIIAILGPADTSCGVVTESDGGFTCVPTSHGQGVEVILSDRADLGCANLVTVLSNRAPLASQDLLGFVVDNENGDLAAGTYDIASTSPIGSGALAQFETWTSTCATALNVLGTSGTVTLTQVSSTSVAGTYSITFGAQGTFSGSFGVPAFCSLPDAGSASPGDAGPTACQP
jgi:hypothetical protein